MASKVMVSRLTRALNTLTWRIERYDRNGHDPPEELWQHHEVLSRALELADAKSSDREIHGYLSGKGITL